jgi:PAS domain S-box-containing protein
MTTVDEGRAAAVSVTGSDLAVSLIDLPSHEIVAVSDSLLGMLDSDRGQMIGCPIETFVAGNHPEVLSLLASGHLDGAEADRMVKGLDGSTFPVHAWAHVLGSRRPARYAVLLVLDRRPVTAAPIRSEGAPVYGAVDVQWRIDHVSSGVDALLGYAPDDLAGVWLSRLIHPDDFPQLFAGLAATSGSRLGALVRVRLLRADGAWRPCRMRLAPLTHPPGFGFILRSMTDPDPTQAQSADIDLALRRLSEYLLVEQSQMPPAQLPTSTELSALSRLSSSEWEVLVRHHTGASPGDIGVALGGDSRTIQVHFNSILDKLGVGTRDELASLLASASKPVIA